MRLIFIIIFWSLCRFAGAQDIFDLIRVNDRKAVKAYEGAVNLRDKDQATPLMWAAFSADKKMVKLLIRKGADPGMKGWIVVYDTINNFQMIYGSCLAIAAGKGKNKLLRYFIKKLEIPVDDREINLDQQTENGWTALHWAALRGNIEGAEFLMKQGARVDAIAPTNFNQTPLHLAISFDQLEMVRYLLESGADYNATDILGISALSYAFTTGSREMVKLLLEAGAKFSDTEHKILKDELHKTFGVEDISEL